MQMVLDLLQNFQGGIRRTISTLGKLMCSGHIVDDSQTGQTDNKDTGCQSACKDQNKLVS